MVALELEAEGIGLRRGTGTSENNVNAIWLYRCVRMSMPIKQHI